MGYFMKEHDVYVGTMLDELNVRFAPPQGKETHFGGIEEMAALQKEFKIFKKGRPFTTSLKVLNIGAFNNDVKNRWHAYLGTLSRYSSNKAGQDGDVAIVNTLVKNLAAKNPMPVHFTSHDMRGGKDNERVIITDKARPLFYLEVDYITISLPMQPLSAVAGKKAGAGKKSAAASGKKKKA